MKFFRKNFLRKSASAGLRGEIKKNGAVTRFLICAGNNFCVHFIIFGQKNFPQCEGFSLFFDVNFSVADFRNKFPRADRKILQIFFALFIDENNYFFVLRQIFFVHERHDV